MFYVCEVIGFVDWLDREGWYIIYIYICEKSLGMCICLWPEFDCPEVTLCFWQDIKIELLLYCGWLRSLRIDVIVNLQAQKEVTLLLMKVFGLWYQFSWLNMYLSHRVTRLHWLFCRSVLYSILPVSGTVRCPAVLHGGVLWPVLLPLSTGHLENLPTLQRSVDIYALCMLKIAMHCLSVSFSKFTTTLLK